MWVGPDKHELWKHSTIPLAIHGIHDRLRQQIIAALASQGRKTRIAYSSGNVAGQMAAVQGGVAIAVATRCSVPSGFQILDRRHGLPELPTVEVALVRSKKSTQSNAIDAMHQHIVRSFV